MHSVLAHAGSSPSQAPVHSISHGMFYIHRVFMRFFLFRVLKVASFPRCSAEIARAGRRAMPMARATPMAMSSQSLTSVDGGGADDTAATCASLFSPPTQPRAPQSEHRDATQCVQTISRPILKAHLRPTLLARGAAAAHPTPISASCAARAARYWRGSGRSVCACLEAGALSSVC